MSRKFERFAFRSLRIPVAMPLRWLCSANPLRKLAFNCFCTSSGKIKDFVVLASQYCHSSAKLLLRSPGHPSEESQAQHQNKSRLLSS
jgi:hypothetical protein